MNRSAHFCSSPLALLRAIGLLAAPWCLALAVVVGPVAVRAQQAPPPGDRLDRYLAEHIEFRPPGLFEPARLLQGGNVVEIGMFAGDAASVFGASDEAMRHIDSFRVQRIAGFTMSMVGIAALVTELVLVLVDSEIFIDKHSDSIADANGLYWGLLGGGLAFGVAGGLLMQSANGHLSDAIDSFNGDLLQRVGRFSGPRLQYRVTF